LYEKRVRKTLMKLTAGGHYKQDFCCPVEL
jgi:hypothetical protein